jgi:hypothetical protein
VTGPVRGAWSAVSRWGAIVAVIAVTAAVGSVAAVISYAHQHALNLAHEAQSTAWTARFWPVTVEGIVLASGLVLVIRRRAGRAGGVIVWSAMLVGAGVTLAANVASAPVEQSTGLPDRTAQAMNAWPPLAFLFAVELLVIAFRPGVVGPVPGRLDQPRRRRVGTIADRLRAMRSRLPRRSTGTTTPPAATEAAQPAALVVVPQGDDASDRQPGPVRPGFSTDSTDEDLAADLLEWSIERGGPVPRDEVMPAYGIGRGRCDRLRSGLGWTANGSDRSGTKRGSAD